MTSHHNTYLSMAIHTGTNRRPRQGNTHTHTCSPSKLCALSGPYPNLAHTVCSPSSKATYSILGTVTWAHALHIQTHIYTHTCTRTHPLQTHNICMHTIYVGWTKVVNLRLTVTPMYYDNTKVSDQVLNLVFESDAHSEQVQEAILFIHNWRD